ncbi:MAG: RNA polymerase factor sigma-54, partial [Rickettsiales bacterium]|nr:RNA polymerase factor sigma-54 [Rickettsiales bacterium]
TEQLHVDVEDPKMRMLGSQLMDMLDDYGYLRESVAELAEMYGVDEKLIEQTLTKLKQFDPPGVFAADVKECLAIQLADQNLLDPLMQCLLDNLHLIEKGDMAGLQKTCAATDEDFHDMLADIRKMDPYPAKQFANDLAQPVVPDVFVRGGKDGIWQVELNHDVLPKVLLNQEYYQQLDTKTRQKDDKKYLSEQLGQANWLVKALDQRAQTIMKVSAEIVKQQEQFLLYGIQFLKPLTLKDIALVVDMHESTISRVTTNKFMSTPRGIFELKYFFTSSVASSSGSDDVSSKTVMYYIKELIDDELPTKILSDDAIVKLLKNKNVDVARRTVAKYREAMHIPSSVVRRRQKKL